MKNKYVTEQSVEDFVSYLHSCEKSGNTVEKYRRDIRKLMEYTSGKMLQKETVIRFKETLSDSYALSSVNSIISAVNRYLSYVGLDEMRVKQYKLQKCLFCSPKKELTADEYFKLIEKAEELGKERLSLLLQTLCSTGIRVGELKYITVESLEKGEVEVYLKGKRRIVFLISRLREKLAEYAVRVKISSGAIFVTSKGNPIDRSNVWKAMKRLCLEASVSQEKLFPHNLRHLFARTFYEIDKDIAKLADILGHSNINTTRIYTVSSGSEHERLMEKMHLVK